MAKSSRSKWKKLHRRQRAQAEVKNTVKRVSKLHQKLRLTAKGGISLVPPQDPESRFHFTNPEKNLRVPDPRREYNNDYRNDRTVTDFSKPLRLAPPKSNVYGKSDIHAPHIMTVNYAVIDADAPIAGHAVTKADVERAAKKAREALLHADEESHSPQTMDRGQDEVDDDGPEEYTFDMGDSAPRKVRHDLMSNDELAPHHSSKIVSMKGAQSGGSSKVKKMSGSSGSSAARIVSSGSSTLRKKKK